MVRPPDWREDVYPALDADEVEESVAYGDGEIDDSSCGGLGCFSAGWASQPQQRTMSKLSESAQGSFLADEHDVAYRGGEYGTEVPPSPTAASVIADTSSGGYDASLPPHDEMGQDMQLYSAGDLEEPLQRPTGCWAAREVASTDQAMGRAGTGRALPEVMSRIHPNQQLTLGPAFTEHRMCFAPAGSVCGGLQCSGLRCESMPRESEIRQMVLNAQTPVLLHVYEVGDTKAVQRVNQMTMNILRRGGVFHGAVEVHGVEWSYGGTMDHSTGVYSCLPRMNKAHTFRESIYLGDCRKGQAEVELIVARMAAEWPGMAYSLLHQNCCHFSDAFAHELGVGGIPSWVNRLARRGAFFDDEAEFMQAHFFKKPTRPQGASDVALAKYGSWHEQWTRPQYSDKL
jgi:hypothetical protein